MDSAKQKEYISLSYIRALAGKSATMLEDVKEDSDSIDIRLKKEFLNDNGEKYWGQIAIQLKSTSSNSQYSEDNDYIYYNLKVKNYNDLRERAVDKKYLALLILPELEEQWVNQSVDNLIIKKCMYWISLKDSPETTNTASIQITIPKINLLTKETIIDLLKNSLN